jgi:UDPglucose 6-dehydrogenase
VVEKIKISVVGSGYVGMSLAVLLAQKNEVIVLDIDPVRVGCINNKKSTVEDFDLDHYLSSKPLSISATLDKQEAYSQAAFVIIATPTNYDPETNRFDTSSVDGAVRDALTHNREAFIVIKSTIPVGHVEALRDDLNTTRIIFSPEFLREGQALKDNLYPSRIIVGDYSEDAKLFASILSQAAESKDVEVLFVSSTEAEAIKLFANSYLAMRVSFFNELDSYALAHQLDTESIINGICLDNRIGKGYNNPSFGYGGYCLPKDTKQLLANYGEIPQTLIGAIVSSNKVRKDVIADEILKNKPDCVGFYKLAMKEGSDNFRSSAIQGVIQRLKEKGLKVVIYEPLIIDTSFLGFHIVKDLAEFKEITDLIVTNRISKELIDVTYKLFSRDIFGLN